MHIPQFKTEIRYVRNMCITTRKKHFILLVVINLKLALY